MSLFFHSYKRSSAQLFKFAKAYKWQTRRQLSEHASKFLALVSSSSSKYQLYISNSDDPILNLSIEHYLLQSTHPTSTILFLYINRPCIVIGRNQNPWLETNQRFLGDASKVLALWDLSKRSISPGPLEAVRRRSGGGTVFHDHGNVNFSVICPPEAFTRDKHAEMIVHAIRHSNKRVRVNERHDIVADHGPLLPKSKRPPDDDTHRSAWAQTTPHKVSGSAYKLTRTRALHHGTCLVSSPNTKRISRLLKSPLAPFVMARGVESVKSPVCNVATKSSQGAIQNFKWSVIEEFSRMYGIDQSVSRELSSPSSSPHLHTFDGGIYGVLGNDLGQIEKIKSGMEEMKSPNWLYGQTPKFTFRTFPTPEDDRPRPSLPASIPSTAKIHFEARSGKITSAQLSLSPSELFDAEHIVGQDIHRLESWTKLLRLSNSQSRISAEYEHSIIALGKWLDELFGNRSNERNDKSR
ncbi:Biotin/lipoate A/B protein ligase [Thelotrema lepadinum]|nr:Biotin/lipoate A/B protein ligase [Thelotrema lepadinum]